MGQGLGPDPSPIDGSGPGAPGWAWAGLVLDPSLLSNFLMISFYNLMTKKIYVISKIGKFPLHKYMITHFKYFDRMNIYGQMQGDNMLI